MLRNYNGAINHSVLRELKKLSQVNAENFKILWDEFSSQNKVSVWTNLCPITHCPDEMSGTVTLKSKAEIKDYLKKDFESRLENYLQEKRPKTDFLLTAVISFLKENEGRYPNKEEMRQLEIAAENERIASALPETETEPPAIQMLLREILELAEEIMETRRETKPEEIQTHVEPYPDELCLSNENCSISIAYRRYLGYGNNRDYSCEIGIDDYQIHLFYCNDTDPDLYVRNWSLDKWLVDVMIQVHQFIAQVAQQEGFEFVSEVDYEKCVTE